MAKAKARDQREKSQAGSPIRFVPALVILSAGLAFALLQPGGAGAQQSAIDPTQSGDIGFAGMLAGLLVVALATLALRHRGATSLHDRLAKLEAQLEER